MSLTVSPESESLDDALAQAASIVPNLRSLAARYDESRSFPCVSFRHIRDAGLLTVPFSIDATDDWLRLLRVLKHVGRGDLSVGRLYEGHVNALQLIQIFGTPEQREMWAADIQEKQMLFAVWNTEAGDGVHLEPLSGGRVRMTGAKTFASGAGQVQRPVITGRLPDGGWQMCVVPMEQALVTIDPSWWQPPGMYASTSFKVDFTGVEIEAGQLLGEPDVYHRQPWFSGGAVRFAAVQLGGAEALLDETRDFLRLLARTGDPFQQSRAGEAAILIESGNLWLEGAARSVPIWQSSPVDVDVETIINYANMTRLAIEQICTRVMDLMAQTVGARGMLRPNPIERIMRDLMLYLRQPAPDAARTSIGKMMLDHQDPAYKVWNGE